ncbi:MAG: heme exporter protein CcmD [Burkholderiaceae bacterium]
MDHLIDLWRLDGHGIFVWGAYAPCLALLVAEAWLVRARVRRARAEADARAAEAQT